MRAHLSVCLLSAFFQISFWHSAFAAKSDDFVFDSPDRTMKASLLPSPNAYEPSIAATTGGFWMAWLEFLPGEGDRLLLDFTKEATFSESPDMTLPVGQYRNPIITPIREDTAWLTYEAEVGKQWDVFISRCDSASGQTLSHKKITRGKGSDINHAAAPDGAGGLWIVWQSDNDGQFDIMARHVSEKGRPGGIFQISDSSSGDWSPDVAVAPDGTVHVVWDSYDGNSYNVKRRSFNDNSWSNIEDVANGPGFEGRAQVACDKDGQTWVVWEEGCVAQAEFQA